MKMKKKLRNIEKLIALMFVCFTTIFTVMIISEYGGIINAFVVKANKNEILNISQEEMNNMARYYEESIQYQFKDANSETETNMLNVYKQYPVGTYAFLLNVAQQVSMSELLIESFIGGIIIGTGIYLFLDNEKKSIPMMIFVYIIGIILLGFVEGIENIGNSLLDKWQFPNAYLLPATLLMAFILALRQVRRKVLANELNRQLKEKQQEKPEDPKEQTILQRTQKTREKIGEIGSEIAVIVIIITISVAILFA